MTIHEKHISKSFDQDLEEATKLFLHMGDSVATQVAKAIHALTDADEVLAQEVISTDHDINNMEVELDEHILLLVAKRQPTANDLRLVMAISKGVVDLERIGDEAVKIAQMASQITSEGNAPRGYAEVQHLGNQVRLMVHNALDAFTHLNAEQAFEVMRNDGVINREYQSAIRALMTYIMEDSRHVSKVINIMWVLRALERIGDHARNVAELVIYSVSGTDVRHSDYANVEKAVQEANEQQAAREAHANKNADYKLEKNDDSDLSNLGTEK
ncbi:phosphate signaling complex protein PhoU [Psychrobacter pygoscelis]|uniref:phosphate signaling complex protein PhoU n=1 Tax=Psychrobacter pygoscelis TaxID=2488563 RepID=UPI00103FEAE8|nr:phosphate signaling complex protein PhoU [Psychrobacter pygoscelis]